MLTASLALSGQDAEASDARRRYLALALDIPKTIAQFKGRLWRRLIAQHYAFKGLRKAGLREDKDAALARASDHDHRLVNEHARPAAFPRIAAISSRVSSV
jgi:hypothetical protein